MAKALRRDFEATANKRRQAHEQVSVLESQVGGCLCMCCSKRSLGAMMFKEEEEEGRVLGCFFCYGLWFTLYMCRYHVALFFGVMELLARWLALLA